MPVQSQALAVAAALGISVSAAAVCLYLLYRREDDNYFDLRSLKPTIAHPAVIEVKVPKDAVGAVIGQQGCNIKKIQANTSTSINFKDDETQLDRIAIIRGTQKNVLEAQRLILQLIHERPQVMSEEMFVPQRACGRLIGKSGDTVRMMMRVSGCKINFSREDHRRNPDEMKRVTLRGTSEEIAIAKALIIEKLQEEENFNLGQGNELSLSSHSEHMKHLSILSKEQIEANMKPRRVKMVPTGSDGFLESYISAVDTAGHFWLQPSTGSRSTELDKLIDEMTDYYNIDENKLNHIPQKLKIGDTSACLSPVDDMWYRVQIVELEEDGYSVEESKVTVYYADFGDTEMVTRDRICTLRAQHMDLPMQAVECYLAKVKPVGGVWSKAASELFKKLSFCSQWKTIMVRPVIYVPPASGDSKDMIAVVELVDTNGTVDVNIAEELVKAGYAVWDVNKKD